MSENRPHYRGGSIVGPVLLIGLGIVLLLQQTGYLNWNLWEIVFRLWPILIIAVGADILIGRRSFLGAMVALLLVLVLLGGGLLLLGVGPVAGGNPLVGESIVQPLGNATSAEISLSPNAGRMEVVKLPESSSNAIEAEINEATAGQVYSESGVQAGKVRVVINHKGPEINFFTRSDRTVWKALLSPKIPIALNLSLGAGALNADLAGLQLESLAIKVGAGEVILTLPDTGVFSVEISMGAGSVNIQLPAGVGVNVHCTTGMGNCNLPNKSGFWSQNYTSSDYETATNKINLKISLGVGEVKIR